MIKSIKFKDNGPLLDSKLKVTLKSGEVHLLSARITNGAEEVISDAANGMLSWLEVDKGDTVEHILEFDVDYPDAVEIYSSEGQNVH